MAAKNGTTSEPLISAVYRFAAEFDFFQAGRIIQAADPCLPRIGFAHRPDEEVVELLQRPSLSFIPSPLVGLRCWTLEVAEIEDARAIWARLAEKSPGALAAVSELIDDSGADLLVRVFTPPEADPQQGFVKDPVWQAAVGDYLERRAAWCPDLVAGQPLVAIAGYLTERPFVFASAVLACELNRVMFCADLSGFIPHQARALEGTPGRRTAERHAIFDRLRRNRVILEDLLSPSLRRCHGLKNASAPVLEVRGLGLFGSNGPLPLWLTEFAFQQQRIRAAQCALSGPDESPDDSRNPMWTESAFVALVHLIQSRLLSFFFRAWDQSQKVTVYDRPGPHPFRSSLDALVGLHEMGKASDERSTTAGLAGSQIRNCQGFFQSLAHGEATVSRYLWEKLTRELQGEIRRYLAGQKAEEGVRRKVIQEINEILKTDDFFEEAGFPATRVSDAARERLAREPRRRGVVGLNRLLLEDAFPLELSSSPYSVMADGMRYYAGRFLGIRRDAAGLKEILEGELGVPVEIVEFVGRWVEVPQSCRMRLGGRAVQDGDASTKICGRRLWDAQNHFRLRVGPVTRVQLEDFLPGRHLNRRLTEWVEVYLGDELAWDLQVVVDRREVPEFRPGKDLRLGWTSWLPCRSKPRADDADDLILRRPAPLNA